MNEDRELRDRDRVGGRGHEDGYFDERIAARYDESAAAMFDPAMVGPVVDTLADLARGHPVLEFAIGTGRIALPLAARGLEVHGIELSRAMVSRLREKPGGDRIPVTVGDMAAVRAPGTFGLVYLVFNTVMNLTTQEAQVACFRNAAAHLGPGGVFVIEVGVPDLRRLPPGERFVAYDITDTRWSFDEYDVDMQGMKSHHIDIVDRRVERFSAPFRYVWPAELDLMAHIAGMTLQERWSGWTREPFTAESGRHVSVWSNPAR